MTGRVPSFAEACYRAKLILTIASYPLCFFVSSDAIRDAAAARNSASFFLKLANRNKVNAFTESSTDSKCS